MASNYHGCRQCGAVLQCHQRRTIDYILYSHDLVSSQVNSPVAAIDLLTELAQIAGDDVQTIRISIALKDNCNRDRYHQLFTDKRQAEIGQEVG